MGPPYRHICWPLCAVVGQPEDQEHEETDEEVDEAEDQLGGGGGDDKEVEEEEQEEINDEQEVDFERGSCESTSDTVRTSPNLDATDSAALAMNIYRLQSDSFAKNWTKSYFTNYKLCKEMSLKWMCNGGKLFPPVSFLNFL